MSDVAQCLKPVSPHKASGSDNIPGIVLQQCSDVLALPFTTLFNASLTSGTVPVCFKELPEASYDAFTNFKMGLLLYGGLESPQIM